MLQLPPTENRSDTSYIKRKDSIFGSDSDLDRNTPNIRLIKQSPSKHISKKPSALNIKSNAGNSKIKLNLIREIRNNIVDDINNNIKTNKYNWYQKLREVYSKTCCGFRNSSYNDEVYSLKNINYKITKDLVRYIINRIDTEGTIDFEKVINEAKETYKKSERYKSHTTLLLPYFKSNCFGLGKSRETKVSEKIDECISNIKSELLRKITISNNHELTLNNECKYILDQNEKGFMYFKTKQINQLRSLTGGDASVFIGKLNYVDDNNKVVTNKKTAYKDFLIGKSGQEINNAKLKLKIAHKKYKNLQGQNCVIKCYAKGENGLYLERGQRDLSDYFNKIIGNRYIETEDKILYSLEELLELFQVVNNLHESGYVHLDLKLKNVLRMKDDTTRLIDLIGIQSIKNPFSGAKAFTDRMIAPLFVNIYSIKDQGSLNNYLQNINVPNLAFLDLYSLAVISLEMYTDLTNNNTFKYLSQSHDEKFISIDSSQSISLHSKNNTKKLKFQYPIDNDKLNNYKNNNPLSLEALIKAKLIDSKDVLYEHILSQIVTMLLVDDPKKRVDNFKQILEHLPKLWNSIPENTSTNSSINSQFFELRTNKSHSDEEKEAIMDDGLKTTGNDLGNSRNTIDKLNEEKANKILNILRKNNDNELKIILMNQQDEKVLEKLCKSINDNQIEKIIKIACEAFDDLKDQILYNKNDRNLGPNNYDAIQNVEYNLKMIRFILGKSKFNLFEKITNKLNLENAKKILKENDNKLKTRLMNQWDKYDLKYLIKVAEKDKIQHIIETAYNKLDSLYDKLLKDKENKNIDLNDLKKKENLENNLSMIEYLLDKNNPKLFKEIASHINEQKAKKILKEDDDKLETILMNQWDKYGLKVLIDEASGKDLKRIIKIIDFGIDKLNKEIEKAKDNNDIGLNELKKRKEHIENNYQRIINIIEPEESDLLKEIFKQLGEEKARNILDEKNNAKLKKIL